jgi:hypothetical protein
MVEYDLISQAVCWNVNWRLGMISPLTSGLCGLWYIWVAIPKSPRSLKKLSGLIKSTFMRGGINREEKSMTKELVYVSVNVVKHNLDVTVVSSKRICQFAIDHERVTNIIQYIFGLKPAKIIIKAAGQLELSLGRCFQY